MPDPDVTFVLPGLRSTGGIRAVFEISDHLRSRGWRTLIQVPRRSLLAPRRSPVGIAQRYGPRVLEPLTRRAAPPGRPEQDWFPLQTPVQVVDDPGRALPGSGAIVVTSYRTAEVVSGRSDRDERIVYFVQGYETWSGPKSRVDRTLRRFGNVIVTAPWLADMFQTRWDRRDVPVAIYGVDTTLFRPAAPARPTTVAPPVVGFAWDDRPVKGGDDVVAALRRLRDDGCDFQARAYGIGSRELPPWVEMSGVLSGEALADHYRSLDLFVSAGRQESGPMSVAEAMACGVAVVATDVGDVRVWSDDGRWVRIVPPRDVDALVAAIEALLADPGERARLARGGTGAIASFGWDRTTTVVEGVLNGLGFRPVDGT